MRVLANLSRLRPKHGLLQNPFEPLQPDEGFLKHQELVLVGGDRIVEVEELSRHQLVLAVVLLQAAELAHFLAELAVDCGVGAFEVTAAFLVEGFLLFLFPFVLVLAVATAIALLLLLLAELVRTFLGGVDVHLVVFRERHVVVEGCVPVRAFRLKVTSEVQSEAKRWEIMGSWNRKARLALHTAGATQVSHWQGY